MSEAREMRKAASEFRKAQKRIIELEGELEQAEAENKRLKSVIKRCKEKAYRGRSTRGHNCDSTNACRSIEEITEQVLQGGER